MPRLTRRNLLGSSAAMLALAATPGFAAIQAGPPIAPVRPVTETYFGVKVTDRYRWMESEDTEWQDYVRAQGAYATRILDKIPGRAQLAAAIAHNTGEVVSVIAIQTGGGRIFTEVRPAGANTSKLFVRDGISGADRKLVDPDTYRRHRLARRAGLVGALAGWQPRRVRHLVRRLGAIHAAYPRHRYRRAAARDDRPHGRCGPKLAAGRRRPVLQSPPGCPAEQRGL